MKKERRPLTKREKVLIGVGVVGIGVAGYFGYKYWENSKNYRALKTINEDLLRELMSRDTEAEIAKKIAAEIERLAINPNDTQTKASLMNHQKFEATLIDKIEKTIELERLIDADENIYA